MLPGSLRPWLHPLPFPWGPGCWAMAAVCSSSRCHADLAFSAGL